MKIELVIGQFREFLPSLVEWIARTITAHEEQAKSFASLRFPNIPRYVPRDLLERARVVYLPAVPQPPMLSLGIPQLADFTKMALDGITFRDMVFVKLRKSNSEDLHLHELVHVAQWDLLGVERFLLAYGIGLAQKGYRSSPLEEMAYMYQTQFTRGILRADMMDDVRMRTNRVWTEVSPLLGPS